MPRFAARVIDKLSETLYHAAGGTSEYYSPKFVGLCTEYHSNGRLWMQHELEDFFQEGLLQHYIGKVSGINLNKTAAYLDDPDSFLEHIYDQEHGLNTTDSDTAREAPWDVSTMIGEHFGDDTEKKKRFVDTVLKLVNKIKTIPILLKKGGDFQRLKQFNEAYQKEIDANIAAGNPSLNQGLNRQVNQNNAEMNRLQLEIYNWVEYFYADLKEFIHSDRFDWVALESNVDKLPIKQNIYPDRAIISQEISTAAATPLASAPAAAAPTLPTASQQKQQTAENFITPFQQDLRAGKFEQALLILSPLTLKQQFSIIDQVKRNEPTLKALAHQAQKTLIQRSLDNIGKQSGSSPVLQSIVKRLKAMSFNATAKQEAVLIALYERSSPKEQWEDNIRRDLHDAGSPLYKALNIKRYGLQSFFASFGLPSGTAGSLRQLQQEFEQPQQSPSSDGKPKRH
jgi:hypothetical protein